MKVTTIHEKGSNAKNEDRYSVDTTNNYFAVIDGATGLGGFGGDIASETIKQEMEKQIQSGAQVIDALMYANRSLLCHYRESDPGFDIHSLAKEKRSSAGLAALQLSKHQMSYVHAGDCMIFLGFHNGDIHHVTYDHLAKLDNQAIQAMYKYGMEKLKKDEDPNAWPEEHLRSFLKDNRNDVEDILVANRRKMNTADGYGIIDGSDSSETYINTGTVQLHGVRSILLLSDGLQIHKEPHSAANAWQDSAHIAFSKGLDELYQIINMQEQNDPACVNYPRLKTADDKTGILIEFI